MTNNQTEKLNETITQTSYGSYHCDICGQEYMDLYLCKLHFMADHNVRGKIKVTYFPYTVGWLNNYDE
jgi:hypothetical protein